MIPISASVTASSPSAVSRVSLRADLARYEKQLADCVNCSSASTPEGKQDIQDLGSQISTLKAKLNVVPQPDATASTGQSKSSTASGALGGRIDMYA